MPPTSRDDAGLPSGPREGNVTYGDFGGAFGVLPDISLLEFCLGKALSRCSPLGPGELAGELAHWFESSVRVSALQAPLKSLADRGWAALGTEGWSLLDRGHGELSHFDRALTRMFGVDNLVGELAILMKLIKVLERSGS
ncbi:MAG: hypothetical protein CVT74_14045 [Alphaproteobacteria bacterium HGW-Alphaproteobacteria-13]|nr:MAG: hypothetical protein CVT74_14045 [Alphaproteobacteria bacterium HGW-Alphaproteobacteria-13]